MHPCLARSLCLQVREYPLYSPAHNEEMDLERIQMPLFPSLDHTHSSPDTIVSLDGMCGHYYDDVTILMQCMCMYMWQAT